MRFVLCYFYGPSVGARIPASYSFPYSYRPDSFPAPLQIPVVFWPGFLQVSDFRLHLHISFRLIGLVSGSVFS